ncbi:PP2C family serine/threonine-protein phosphatase [Salinibacterium sp. M195]|uniref:PP2C family protein-serine/threonine phosphatase n=1 Tax=Salinibacterium sp. M195 TaxID=2583374 RepID=UPI002106ECCE|nr:protein phosphatase 2C domain-containing protein [Salinibacterium sp. M195]
MITDQYELVLPSGPVNVHVSAASDRGSVRSINEDSFLVLPRLFLVADGMGGHSFGDRASQCVVQSFARAMAQHDLLTPADIVQAIIEANSAVMNLNKDDEAVSGTTLSGLALVSVGVDAEPRWMAFNVGDSRVYSWDGRQLEQVTVDHSAVQELLDLGHITALEATTHPERNVITRALGIHEEVNPDFWLLPVGTRHTFVACSDGLTKELDDDLIAGILADRAALSDGVSFADRLVAGALAAGGSDNVTVIVVEASRTTNSDSANEDTVEREIPQHLEETRPRK